MPSVCGRLAPVQAVFQKMLEKPSADLAHLPVSARRLARDEQQDLAAALEAVECRVVQVLRHQ